MEKLNINKIKRAREIAKKNLQKCYFKDGILASCNHFSDFWARDSFWALGGILEIGDYKKANSIFRLFLSYQRTDGKIPRKIMLEYAFLKYIFKIKIKRKNPKPIYFGLVPPFHSMDDNSLLIIAFWKYIQKTQDREFAEENYRKIKKAVEWYENKKSNGLINEYFLANWSDTIFRSGNVLYTNALYYEALKSLSEVAEFLGKSKDKQTYFQKSEELKKSIDNEFWNGEFYNSQPNDRKHFDTIGNTLVGLYDIASKNKKEKIIEKLKEIKTEKLLPTTFPKYSFWKVNPLTRLVGIADYHNGASWLWIDLLAVLLEHKEKHVDLALKNMEQISEIILRDEIVYETYHNDGSVYNKLFWKSAAPFAWNAGIFLEVYHFLDK